MDDLKPGRPKNSDSVSPLESLGVSKKQSSRWQQMFRAGQTAIENCIAETKKAKEQVTLAALRTSIVLDGCRDPIVIWEEEHIVIDGHHRRGICEEHGIEYEQTFISLPDRNAAKLWMLKNARARRNLTPDQLSYLRGLEYNLTKEPHGGGRKPSPQNEDLKSSHRLAEEHGVSHATIERDAKYAEAVDKLGLQSEVAQGQVSVPRAAVVKAAESLGDKAEPEDVEAAKETVVKPHVSRSSGCNECVPVHRIRETRRLACVLGRMSRLR